MPRTRVYEAVRSLESDGLVEIQHSSPQQFRAIPLSEALQVLDKRHQDRIDRLEGSLRELREGNSTEDRGGNTEVWSLTGTDTITSRAKRLIDSAESEVLMLVGDRQAVSNGVNNRLVSAADRGVDVVVGASSESLRSHVSESTSELFVFDSELDWLSQPGPDVGISVGRLLVIDDAGLLASTVVRSDGTVCERAVCGNGSSNGLVYVLRGLLSTHLDHAPDP